MTTLIKLYPHSRNWLTDSRDPVAQLMLRHWPDDDQHAMTLTVYGKTPKMERSEAIRVIKLVMEGEK